MDGQWGVGGKGAQVCDVVPLSHDVGECVRVVGCKRQRLRKSGHQVVVDRDAVLHVSPGTSTKPKHYRDALEDNSKL